MLRNTLLQDTLWISNYIKKIHFSTEKLQQKIYYYFQDASQPADNGS